MYHNLLKNRPFYLILTTQVIGICPIQSEA